MDVAVHLSLCLVCILSTLTALNGLCHKGGGCLCSDLSVNCSNVDIMSFPSDLPNNITELIINGANIHILSNIPNYENLTTLRITQSHVRYITPGAFKNLSKLDHLILSENDLTALWPGTFEGLTSLRLLSLERNAIHVIPNDTLKGANTPNLEFLKLSHCEIYNIESNALYELINLKELLLDDNKLHSVPKIGKIIGDVEALETLDLSENLITQITGDPFTQLQHLKTLRLNHNQIHYMSIVAFVGLDKLHRLDLRGNNLRIYNSDTFQVLSSLIDLDLSYNSFRTLAKEDLPSSLERLHLHHNMWRCECKISWMLSDTRVNNTNAEMPGFVCETPQALKNRQILSLSKRDLCGEQSQGGVKVSVVLGVVLCILAGAVIIYIACMIYRKRQRKRRQQLSVPYSQVNRETELFSV